MIIEIVLYRVLRCVVGAMYACFSLLDVVDGLLRSRGQALTEGGVQSQLQGGGILGERRSHVLEFARKVRSNCCVPDMKMLEIEISYRRG